MLIAADAAVAAADEAAALAAAAAVDETTPAFGRKNGNADAALALNKEFNPVGLNGLVELTADAGVVGGMK